jgi:hypothetical protein
MTVQDDLAAAPGDAFMGDGHRQVHPNCGSCLAAVDAGLRLLPDRSNPEKLAICDGHAG